MSNYYVRTTGASDTHIAAMVLIHGSVKFTCEPLPNDRYELVFDTNVGLRNLVSQMEDLVAGSISVGYLRTLAEKSTEIADSLTKHKDRDPVVLNDDIMTWVDHHHEHVWRYLNYAQESGMRNVYRKRAKVLLDKEVQG